MIMYNLIGGFVLCILNLFICIVKNNHFLKLLIVNANNC